MAVEFSCSRKQDKCGQSNRHGSPVIAEVCVGKRLHRSVSEEAPPRDSLFPRGSQLDSWPAMLLVPLELCSHLRLLDGDTTLNLLKPHCPSQACATKPLRQGCRKEKKRLQQCLSLGADNLIEGTDMTQSVATRNVT